MDDWSPDFSPEQTLRFYEKLPHGDIENATKEQAVYILTGEVNSHYQDLDTDLRELQDYAAFEAERIEEIKEFLR